MRAGLYARVSRKEQAKKGHSIEEQLDILRAYAAGQGWQVKEYTDPGESSRDRNRPGLQEMLADAEAGLLSHVVVWKLDRFFSQLEGQIKAVKLLNQHKVTLVSLTEPFDFTTDEGEGFLNTMGAFNQYRLKIIQQRVRLGKRGRARKGMHNASTIPYGYRREKIGDKQWKDPEPDPEKAPAVELAFEAYATGQYTDQEIADLLNREGFPTYGRRWKDKPPISHWVRGTVRKMLKNPYYVGWVRYGDDLHEGQHKPIISQELFDQAQQVRAERGHFARGGRQASGVYLLHRVARCVHCGGAMHMEYKRTRGQHVYSYYRCPAAVNGLPCFSRSHRANGHY